MAPLRVLLHVTALMLAVATASQDSAEGAGWRGAAEDMGADEVEEEEEDAISADDVRVALRAWTKLRDGLRERLAHGAHRRSAEAPYRNSRSAGSPRAAAARAVEAEAGADASSEAKRVRVTEFTLSAESSFTAVSRALDRLAKRARGADAPLLAATEFVVEGHVDADTIKNYLRSKSATASLAKAEAEALRRVVGKLLDNNAAQAVDTPSTTSTKAPIRRREAHAIVIEPTPRGRRGRWDDWETPFRRVFFASQEEDTSKQPNTHRGNRRYELIAVEPPYEDALADDEDGYDYAGGADLDFARFLPPEEFRREPEEYDLYEDVVKVPGEDDDDDGPEGEGDIPDSRAALREAEEDAEGEGDNPDSRAALREAEEDEEEDRDYENGDPGIIAKMRQRAFMRMYDGDYGGDNLRKRKRNPGLKDEERKDTVADKDGKKSKGG